jgi:predicted FMN-binding regulatory protein PaiB
MKALPKGKFIALSALLKKLEKYYTSNLAPYLKKQTHPGEVVKLRVKINQIETKRKIQKNQQNQKLVIEKINKIDKPIAKLTKGHREHIQNNKI